MLITCDTWHVYAQDSSCTFGNKKLHVTGNESCLEWRLSHRDCQQYAEELVLMILMTIKIMMMTFSTMVVMLVMLLYCADHDDHNEETWLKTLTTCLSVGQRDMGGAKDGRRVRKASDKWTGPFSKWPHTNLTVRQICFLTCCKSTRFAKAPIAQILCQCFFQSQFQFLFSPLLQRGQHNGWKAKQYFDKTNDGDVERIGAVVGVVTLWSVSLTEEKTRPLERLPTPYLATIVYHPGLEELELIKGMNLGKNRQGFGVC